MRFKRLITFVNVSLLIFAISVTSCTTINEKSTAKATVGISGAKRFLLVRPKIKMYELSVGGINTEKQEWTKAANDNAVDAIRQKLIDSGKEVVVIDSDEYKEETGDLLGIYETVQTNIQRHVMGHESMKFSQKAADFKFWSGDTKALMQRFNVDYVIVVYGYGQLSSSGRKAAQVAGAVLGAFTGVYAIQSDGFTQMSLGILDKDGMIVWYGANTPEESADFRDKKEVSSMVGKMFEKLYKPKKK